MHTPADSEKQTSGHPSGAKRALIFDSGVGALSVFTEINKLQPELECILALDNARFPYGILKESELLARVILVVGKLIERHRPDLVVIACNTASTLVLDELRQRHKIPFVGVVPAIKPAAARSQTQSIGLLATPATVDRTYTNNLIQDFAPGAQILRVGSADLVYMAERKLRGQPVDLLQLEAILAPFIEHTSLDTLVLACTHFPLLHEEMRQILPQRISILDCGAAIAQRVHSLLPSVTGEHPVAHQLFLTAPDTNLDAMTAFCHTLGITHTEVIEL